MSNEKTNDIQSVDSRLVSLQVVKIVDTDTVIAREVQWCIVTKCFSIPFGKEVLANSLGFEFPVGYVGWFAKCKEGWVFCNGEIFD